jgi:hypothetical protein
VREDGIFLLRFLRCIWPVKEGKAAQQRERKKINFWLLISNKPHCLKNVSQKYLKTAHYFAGTLQKREPSLSLSIFLHTPESEWEKGMMYLLNAFSTFGICESDRFQIIANNYCCLLFFPVHYSIIEPSSKRACWKCFSLFLIYL